MILLVTNYTLLTNYIMKIARDIFFMIVIKITQIRIL